MRGQVFEERYPSCERIWLQVGVADTKSATPLLFVTYLLIQIADNARLKPPAHLMF